MTDSIQRPDPAIRSPQARRFQTPSWLDRRLVAGVVLVLSAVLVGAMVVGSADKRQPVWAMSRDVEAGTVLTPADLETVRVQLGSTTSRYLPASEAVTGRTVQHRLRAGELLPREQLTDPEPGMTIAVPLLSANAPNIARGDRVTLWLSTKTCRGLVLLSGVAVQGADRRSTGGFESDSGSLLVVTVSSADALRVVSALDLAGAVIRVGLLSPGQPAEQVATDLGSCAGVTK